MAVRKLYRSRNDRMLAGICGGLGDMFSVDSTFIRLVVILLCILTGFVPFLIVYLIGWGIIPEDNN